MSWSGGLLGVMHFAAGVGVGRGWRVRQEREEGGLGEERGKRGKRGKRGCIDSTVPVPG